MQDLIGRYEIRRELGRGGMATVYLGYDPRFNRRVAIKVLPRQFTHDPRYLARFEQEAKTIATLEHPAIVPVYDFGEHEDAPYLVMRYMSGGSLRDRLNGEPQSLEVIASALEWLAPAVDYAHELDIVHRDLKPANILYDHEGRPYLADFGIARLAEASHTMTVVGTPAYMSPEQVEGSERPDGRADIYAMGVILYELLSGEQPYTAETPTKQMMAHVLQPVPDILQANPDLPPEAQDVIEKVMAKDRDERYATAGELATAVRGLAAPPSPPAVEKSDTDVATAPPPQTAPEPEPPVVVPVPLPQTTPEPEPPVDSLSPDEAIEDGAPQAEPDLAEEEVGVGEPAAGLPTASRDGGSEPPAEPPVRSGDDGGGVPNWVWLVGALALAAIAIFGLRACIDGSGEENEPLEPTIEIVPEEEASPVAEEPPVEEPEQEESLVCSDEIGCVEVAPGEPVRLASSLVISGPYEHLGIDSQRGVELALSSYGELLGHAVELQAEDAGCTAEGGRAAAEKIVSNPQIVAMIGTTCSDAGVPAAGIISEAGYAMVSPSNTAPYLTDPGQPGYYRTVYNDEVQGPAMAEFAIEELGVSRVAVIHDGSSYSNGLAAEFAESFEALGGTIVAFEEEDPAATDVEMALETVAAADPELIYYPVYSELGSLLTSTIRTIPALDGVILAASDAVQTLDFLNNTGGMAEGLYLSGPDQNYEAAYYEEEFLPNYVERYGSEPTAVFHAHAFDATNMILTAVEEVAQQGSDGTLLIGRQALRDALSTTEGFVGITGILTCDENGDCADPRIAVSQVYNGEFVPVWSQSGSVSQEAGAPAEEESSSAEVATVLNVWSFNNEIATMTTVFEDLHPGVDVQYTMIPLANAEYNNDLLDSIGTDDAPDVIALDAKLVQGYVESDLLADLNDLRPAAEDAGTYPFVSEVGTSGGVTKAYSYQISPGMLFYRRSLAKEYFGTDDPDQIQELLSDMDRFIEAAAVVYDKSGGDTYMIASHADLEHPFMANREQSWIVDGELVVDPKVEEYVRVAKLFRDASYEAQAAQFEKSWYAGVSDNLTDAAGNPKQIFSYFLPPWGLAHVLMSSADNDVYGDWGVVAGPLSYDWGGTWLGALKDSPNLELAKEFIKFAALDSENLANWATGVYSNSYLKSIDPDVADDQQQYAGDLVSSQVVVEAITDEFDDSELSSFLGGQNPYASFAEAAPSIDARLMQISDSYIQSALAWSLNFYLNGEISEEEMWVLWKDTVHEALPDLIVN